MIKCNYSRINHSLKKKSDFLSSNIYGGIIFYMILVSYLLCLEITELAAPYGRSKKRCLQNGRKPNAACDVYENRRRRYVLAALQ